MFWPAFQWINDCCYLLIVTILTIMKCLTFQNWVGQLSFGLCWDIWTVITGQDVTEKANQTQSSTQDTFALMCPHLNVPFMTQMSSLHVNVSLCFMFVFVKFNSRRDQFIPAHIEAISYDLITTSSSFYMEGYLVLKIKSNCFTTMFVYCVKCSHVST